MMERSDICTELDCDEPATGVRTIRWLVQDSHYRTCAGHGSEYVRRPVLNSTFKPDPIRKQED